MSKTNNIETLCKINENPKSRKPKITHIFMNEKHLTKIPKSFDSNNVQILYLHNNAISKIINLHPLRNLTHLYLQWNKIDRMENLENLKQLKKLYLGNNHISVIEKLETLENLLELHVEKQTLNFGETICFEPRCLAALGNTLQVLNISDNRLLYFDEISVLKYLTKLNARNNNFSDYNVVGSHLRKLLYLKEIDLSGNPMCKKHRYKEKIIGVCHTLAYIDGEFISDNTRRFLRNFDSSPKKKASRVIDYYVDKYVVKSHSPDEQLTYLETQRNIAKESLLERRKNVSSINGVVPRCFWKNKTTKKINKNNFVNNAPFGEFIKSTEWP